MNKYSEVHSLEESLAILKKYKDDLTKEQYEAIRSNIGSFAIEGMFLNQRNIIDNIKILKGEMTADEIIAEYKKKWSVSDLNNSDLEQNSKIENL
ncbi:antitoxin VbhA family protein [Campylobacter vicugnae]|uniref:antitoxin VbhA family protein n=1 Tax=Campylobacter vicugnae TaxID=1660076 RepID=UPI000A32C514|nr:MULTISPECIES: antitoxin VbhA family protein [unclassified Campylobacter]